MPTLGATGVMIAGMHQLTGLAQSGRSKQRPRKGETNGRLSQIHGSDSMTRFLELSTVSITRRPAAYTPLLLRS